MSDWIATPTAQALGWTLLHSLWQVAAVAVVVAPVLALMRRADATHRYLVCCLGMGAMLALPVATFVLLRWTSAPELVPVARMLMHEDLGSLTLAPALSSTLPWLTAGWMLGVSFFAARSGLFWVRARRMSRSGLRPAPNAVQRMVVMLGSELGLRRTVRVFESALASVPSVVGWLSPVVLLPVGACQALTAAQVRSIVAHEMAHIRRHDELVNWLQTLFECLLFYHPAAWWLSGRLRAEREYCCDDVAVGICGNAKQYARALWTLETLRGASHPVAVSTGDVALSSHGGSLMERITRLVGVADAPRRRPAGWLAPGSAALLMVAALAATGFALPQDADDCDVDVECPLVVESDGGVWVADCGVEVDGTCSVTIDCSVNADGEYEIACIGADGELTGEVVNCEIVTLDGEAKQCAVTIMLGTDGICEDTPDKLIVDGNDFHGEHAVVFATDDDSGGLVEFAGEGLAFARKLLLGTDDEASATIVLSDDVDHEPRVISIDELPSGRMIFLDSDDGEPVILELDSSFEWSSDEPERIIVRSSDDAEATLVMASDDAEGVWSTIAPHGPHSHDHASATVAPHDAHPHGHASVTVETHEPCDEAIAVAPRARKATRAFTVRRDVDAPSVAVVQRSCDTAHDHCHDAPVTLRSAGVEQRVKLHQLDGKNKVKVKAHKSHKAPKVQKVRKVKPLETEYLR